MPYGRDVDESTRIVNRIDDAVVADSDSPEILGTFELATTRGPWILRQELDAAKDSRPHWSTESFEFLARASSEGDFVNHHYRRLPPRPSRRLTLARDSRGSFARDLAMATS